MTAGAKVSIRFSHAFAKAESAAFTKLLQELQSSPTFAQHVKAEIEKRSLPSDLRADVDFDDNHALLPNRRLDAGEEAELVVTVKNQGSGAGYGVVLAVSAD